MTAKPLEDEAEKPLDPAVERVRAKLARLMAVSVSIMLIGIAAVLGAIVWKMRQAEPGPSALATEIAIPAGATVLGHALGDGMIALRLRLADGGEALLLQPHDGGVPRLVRLVPKD